MKVAVMGCGAMGSIYAALLATSGNEVVCIDNNEAHVAAINRDGLRVSGASGDRRVAVDAYTSASQCSAAGAVDLLIIALKASHVPAAATAAAITDRHTTVLTIQNGLGSADIVAELFGTGRLIVGVAQGFGASMPEPGHSHHNDMKAIRMGRFDPGSAADLDAVVSAFQEAGFDTMAEADIAVLQWEKLICNVAYSGPCALTGMTVGEVLDDPIIGPVSRAAAVEAYDVARQKGVNIQFTDPEAYVAEFAARMRAAKPSVLLDIEAGRPSEIDVINGAIANEAKKLGMTAPVNETIAALVRSMETRAAQT